jgi:hypothetical protein
MKDCAGCVHLSEEAGPDGAFHCAHPEHHVPIADLESPPCKGKGFDPRFPRLPEHT